MSPPSKFLGSPYLQDPDLTICNGDVRDVLVGLPNESVQMCVTSPPYWGLRDYGTEGQIGLEPTPEAFVATMVEVFGEVRRVLRRDGTLWLNLGDSYGEKQLQMIPARVALALQADGWYLRSEITWCKKNCMPESVTDRPTQATEKVYLLSKSARYFYDAEAVRVPYKYDGRKVTHVEGREGSLQHRSGERWPGIGKAHHAARAELIAHGHDESEPMEINHAGRNLRNWWEIATEPYPEAHFATYPTELVRRCILAGSAQGDVVLDPFAGSGTTAYVARKLARRSLLIELSESYCALAARRTHQLSLEAEVA